MINLFIDRTKPNILFISMIVKVIRVPRLILDKYFEGWSTNFPKFWDFIYV